MTPLGSKGLSHSICTERDVRVTGRGGGWSVGGAGRVWSFLSGPRLQHWLHKRWFLKDFIKFTQKKSKCLNEQALLIPDNRCRPQLQPNIEWKGVNHEASAAGRFPLRATGWKFSQVLDCHKRKHKSWVKKEEPVYQSVVVAVQGQHSVKTDNPVGFGWRMDVHYSGGCRDM